MKFISDEEAQNAANILSDYDKQVKCPSCNKPVSFLRLYIGWGKEGWTCEECFGDRSMEE